MKDRALVELTIRYGNYGHKSKTVSVQISEELAHELMDGVELSDEPFSLMCAGPKALTYRRKAFAMRRSVAQDIARAVVPALLDAFGVNDRLDGYSVEGMSKEERQWHADRGRLPRKE